MRHESLLCGSSFDNPNPAGRLSFANDVPGDDSQTPPAPRITCSRFVVASSEPISTVTDLLPDW